MSSIGSMIKYSLQEINKNSIRVKISIFIIESKAFLNSYSF